MKDARNPSFLRDDSALALDEPITGPSVQISTGPRSSAALEAIELPLEVRLGETEWRLGDVVGLRVGDAVPLPAGEDDAVSLYVQGRLFATGDLILVDGRFAFRVRALSETGRTGR